MALKRKVHIIENIDNEFVEGNIEEKDLNGFFFVRRNELLECYKYVGY